MAGPGSTPETAQDVLVLLREWRDTDEPLVEAIGNTFAEFQTVDSQELARRVLDTVIKVLEREVPAPSG